MAIEVVVTVRISARMSAVKSTLCNVNACVSGVVTTSVENLEKLGLPLPLLQMHAVH